MNVDWTSAKTVLPADLVRFLRVEPRGFTSDCWIWTGALNSRGYGGYYTRPRRTVLPHRFTYQQLVGAIPEALQLDHLCRVIQCCNPAHLEPVTAKVNSERSERATKTHCVRGHLLAGGNLRIKPRERGRTQRVCRTCAALHSQRYRLRNIGLAS